MRTQHSIQSRPAKLDGGRLFFLTIGFDVLEVLALVEDAALGVDHRLTGELFGTLVRQVLFGWLGRDGKHGIMPDARQSSLSTFQLTLLARGLQGEQTFCPKSLRCLSRGCGGRQL